jgi:glycine/D-amino acid oxidase-like deaminating enzyme
MNTRIVVVGGGISGSAAAWKLREFGAEVILLEARGHLGGRLTSHSAAESPTLFDNGPHLFLSTYTQMRRFLQKLNLKDEIIYPYPGRVPFILDEGRRADLKEYPLPAPYHLAAGLLNFQALPLRSRLRILKAVHTLLISAPDPTQSAARWLEGCSGEEERRIFWRPLIRAALNAPAEALPVQHLRAICREGFCKKPIGGRLGYARRPLQDLFSRRMQPILEDAGIQIHLKTTCESIKVEENRVQEVLTKGGGRFGCDAVCLALPPGSLLSVLKNFPEGELIIQDYHLRDWRGSPITTLYLWADERPLLEAYACLPDGKIGWVFDYGRMWSNRTAPLALMLNEPHDRTHTAGSASPAEADARLQLIELADALLRAFPQLQKVRWKHWKLVTAPQATPLRPPALWGKALPQVTRIPNLILCGDWLDSDLPPTVEAGVRAGWKIANICLQRK